MRQKKKVLQYFWGKLDAGGAETFIINLFSQMDKGLFDVDFLVYEDKKYFYSDKVKELGGNVVALSKSESRFFSIRLLKRWRRLYKLLKNGQYDVFHCNCDFSLKFVELFLAKKAGIEKRICHSHNSALETTTLKGKVSYIVHLVCRPILVHFSTDLLACSEESADWLFGKKNAKRHKAIVINNGIDAEYYAFDKEAREQYRKEIGVENEILLGNVGRFTQIKNQKYIIDIVEFALRNNYKVKACLIGAGEEFKNVESIVKERCLDNNIVFVGTTDRVRDYLMAFDCYVMPSLYEGLPVSGIEAQATGLPCVVSSTVVRQLDITGNVSFVDLDAGVEYWWNEILKLSSLSRNDMKDQVCQAGYDIGTIAKRVVDIYQQE